MPAKGRWKTRSVKTERFTIWDNYERHVEELKALGAKARDLDPLKQAAEAVSVEEQKEDREKGRNPALETASYGDITAPYECANQWVIQPPTRPAKRWAAAAMMKVTGGREPDDPIGLAYSILAGLWILKAWGEGRKDLVMKAVTAPGALAELLPALEDQCGDIDVDALALDYQTVMGLGKKNSPARAKYLKTLSKLRKTFSGQSTAVS